jgi:3-oxoacyl-[acyl-carrier-protein] synthase-3
MNPPKTATAERWRELVGQCVRRELTAGAVLPSPEEDLVDCGAVDSMAWVSVIRGVEAASGCSDFGDLMLDRPRSMEAMVSALQESTAAKPAAAEGIRRSTFRDGAKTAIAGWGAAAGARRVTAAELEREFELPAGKIGKGAGIESVARAADGEDEGTLAARACELALRKAGTDIGGVDCIVATSETHAGFPSFGGRLHAQLLADANCAALDIGGGCLGAVNALAVAQSLIAAGTFRAVLIATADVHSRILTPARVRGEFGALFGDGASAFVLTGADGEAGSYSPGEFLFGCDPTAASAIRVGLSRDLTLELDFDGGDLARAAVTRLQELIEHLELKSGASRAAASAFATHQPNPRLVDLLARQLRVPKEKFPAVARTHGNLGSSTCAMALSLALDESAARPANERGPIFVAALGPGLLWGGTVLLPDSATTGAG